MSKPIKQQEALEDLSSLRDTAKAAGDRAVALGQEEIRLLHTLFETIRARTEAMEQFHEAKRALDKAAAQGDASEPIESPVDRLRALLSDDEQYALQQVEFLVGRVLAGHLRQTKGDGQGA